MIWACSFLSQVFSPQKTNAQSLWVGLRVRWASWRWYRDVHGRTQDSHYSSKYESTRWFTMRKHNLSMNASFVVLPQKNKHVSGTCVLNIDKGFAPAWISIASPERCTGQFDA